MSASYKNCRIRHNSGAPINSATPLYTATNGQIVRSRQVGADQYFRFVSPSTPANTQLTATLTPSSNPCYEHQMIVYNPSDESDLTVKVFHVCTPGLTGTGTNDIS